MGLFGGNDHSNAAMLQQLANNRGLFQQIELPKYQEYVPKQYDNDSYNYQLTSEDPVAKSKQLEALSQLKGLSTEGLNDADVASFQKAQSMGDQMARSKTAAAMQDAQARGVAGGGLEFAMREAGNQDATQRAQDAALAQASARTNQRGQYLQAYANQLGNVRQQDYNANAANTNVINQFNQMNTAQRNATRNANVDSTNSAFKYNQGLQDKNYANQLTQADRQSGINTQEGQMIAAQQEADRRSRAAMVGVAGAGIGAMVGGPAGAAVGYQAGNALY